MKTIHSLHNNLGNKRILVIGGSGFLGQNLVKKLLSLGCTVTIFSRGSTYNNMALFDTTRVDNQYGNITDKEMIEKLIKNKQIIFNLAGQGPAESMDDPLKDLCTTCRGNLNILESCRRYNPHCRIIIISSRHEFGVASRIPVSENHASDPISFYGIHKLTVRHYAKLYFRRYALPVSIARFSNLYGPHSPDAHNTYNVINRAIDQALQGKTITIFGNGTQLRDYMYVEDAVSALISLALSSETGGASYNFGTGHPIRFVDMIRLILGLVGKGSIKHAPWSNVYQEIETGDFVADYSNARLILNWKPTTGLKEGLSKTIRFQRKLLLS